MKRSVTAARRSGKRRAASRESRFSWGRRLFLEALEDRTLLAADTLGTALRVSFFDPGLAVETASVTGRIASAHDVVLTALTLSAGDAVTAAVSTQSYGGGLDGYLRVFNGSGTQIASDNDFDGRDPRLTFQASEAGTYYVGVSGVGNTVYDPNKADSGTGTSTGLFDLNFSKPSTPPPLLPDLVGASFQVANGTAVWGDTVTVHYSIENRGGADTAVSAPDGFDVEVRLSADNLIDDSDSLLTTLHVDGLAAGASTGVQTLTLTLPGMPGGPPADFAESGQVFLGLRVDPGNVVTESNDLIRSSPKPGTDLDALDVLTAQAEVEPNNNTTTATPVALNSRVTGTLDVGDKDFYKIVLTQPGRLTSGLTGNGLNTRLSLFDAKGIPLILSDGQSPTNRDPSIDQHLDGQFGGTTYYLKVEGLSGGTGEYTLTTEFVPATPPVAPISLEGLPVALVTGDFDPATGDTDLGLAISSSTSNDVAVFQGNGDGTFVELSRSPVGNGPQALVAEDFNGDGYLDLATANSLSNDVSVLLGTVGKGDGTFQAAVSYPVGDSPVALVAGDFNGDGITDLAVANQKSQDVSILLGVGDGTFRDGGRFPLWLSPDSLVVADFNGDGVQDLAAADGSAGAVSVLLGNGDGTFGAPQQFAAGSDPVALVAGDFNGDHHTDLAAADGSAGAVSVLLGNGDGTFGAPQQFAAGSDPVALVAGDFNGDHHTDLAAADGSAGAVSVLLGNGDGTFGAPHPFAAGSDPVALVAGEFDGDGHLDLATANSLSASVSVLLGNGDGSFQNEQESNTNTNPYAIATADFNGDGIPDLAVANDNSDDVSILLGLGDGTYKPQLEFPVGLSPEGIVAGDFNGDGIPDLAVANYSDDTVSVLLGNGHGTFRPAKGSPYSLDESPSDSVSPVGIVAGDFNGDGILDLATANSDSGDVSILLGEGDGSFSNPTRVRGVGNDPEALVAGDFTGDGILDLAVANKGSNDVAILKGTGAGNFSIIKRLLVGKSPVAIVAADFNGATDSNGNRILDLATANVGSDDVSVALGRGDGTFMAPMNLPTGISPSSLRTGDFNNDGILDLAVSNILSGSVSLLLGRGDGQFQSQRQFAVGESPYDLVAGDFNGDGSPDIATANYDSGDVSILVGTGQGALVGSGQPLAGDDPFGVVAGDFNGDGVPDLAIANLFSNQVSVLLGQGDGTFQNAGQYRVGMGPFAIAAADFNRDGRLDLAVANRDSGDVSILLGTGDGRFQVENTIKVGIQPEAIFVGDFNGDGIPDLAVASKDSVSVLFGDGHGDFEAQGVYPVPDGTYSLVAGDFDNNGTLDLASANNKTITVLLNQGRGLFKPLAPFASGSDNLDLKTADLNHDGKLDLVSADGNGDDVRVFLGNGNGTFTPAGSYPVGARPLAIAIGDFNNGQLDLAVANANSNDVSVLLGNGDGSFQAQQLFPVGLYPSGIVTEDFNGDGRLDFAVVNADSGTASVFLGAGHGQFLSADSVANAVPAAPLIGDFAGDGVPDLVILRQDGRILFRRGRAGQPGAFDAPVILNPDFPAKGLAVVSINGHKELAALDAKDVFVSLYTFQASSGTFVRTPGPQLFGSEPERIVAGDLNGDGRDDLVVAATGSNQVFVYLQDATGNFATTPNYSLDVGAAPSALSLADMNGDGRPDIVVANQFSGDVSIFLNDASDPFAEELRYRAGGGPYGLGQLAESDPTTAQSREGTAAVLAGRFDDLGTTDLVVLNRGPGEGQVLLGTGRGGVLNPQAGFSFPAGVQVTAVVAGRFDKNSPNTDLAVLDRGSDKAVIRIFTGDGEGHFTQTSTLDAGNAPTGLALADVTGPGGGGPDGIPDLLVGNQYGDVLILPGLGNGTFQPYQRVDQSVTLAQAADNHFVLGEHGEDQIAVTNGVDSPSQVFQDRNDGILAPGAVQTVPVAGTEYLVVANSGANDVLVYRGDGHGHFDPKSVQTYFAGTDPVGITIQDVNGDGIPDVIVANKGSNDVSILLGLPGGNWTLTNGPRLSVGQGPVSTTLTTVNGVQYLAVANSESNDVWMLPSRGSGFFSDRPADVKKIPVGQDPTMIIAPVGGPPRLITSNAGSNNVTVISDLGAAVPTQVDVATGGTRPVAEAFDAAGNLVVANNGDGVIGVLLDGPTGLTLGEAIQSDVAHPTDLIVDGENAFLTGEGLDTVAILSLATSSPPSIPPPPEEPHSGGERPLVPELSPLNGSSLNVVPTLTASGSQFANPGAAQESGLGGLTLMLSLFIPGVVDAGSNTELMVSDNPPDFLVAAQAGPIAADGEDSTLNQFIIGIQEQIDRLREMIRTPLLIPEQAAAPFVQGLTLVGQILGAEFPALASAGEDVWAPLSRTATGVLHLASLRMPGSQDGLSAEGRAPAVADSAKAGNLSGPGEQGFPGPREAIRTETEWAESSADGDDFDEETLRLYGDVGRAVALPDPNYQDALAEILIGGLVGFGFFRPEWVEDEKRSPAVDKVSRHRLDRSPLPSGAAANPRDFRPAGESDGQAYERVAVRRDEA